MNLDNSAKWYDNEKNRFSQRFRGESTFKLILPYILKSERILHLGLGNGLMVKRIDEFAKKQIVIEGSEKLIDGFKDKLLNTEIIHGYFESFDCDETFDLILATHVLEHVDDPILLLTYLSSFLNENGKLLIIVPNAQSLHRRIGVELGIIKTIYELHNGDKEMGHQRIYDIDKLRNDVLETGYKIIREQGYLLKMRSLEQIMNWNDDFINANYDVSLNCSIDICVNLMLICEL